MRLIVPVSNLVENCDPKPKFCFGERSLFITGRVGAPRGSKDLSARKSKGGGSKFLRKPFEGGGQN